MSENRITVQRRHRKRYILQELTLGKIIEVPNSVEYFKHIETGNYEPVDYERMVSFLLDKIENLEKLFLESQAKNIGVQK